MFSQFLLYHLRHFRRYLSTQLFTKLVVILVMLVAFLLVAAGAFLFFRNGLFFITVHPFVSQTMPFYVYQVLLLTITYLILISALITSLFHLFRARFDGWLLASPRYRALPFYVLARTFATSVWPLLLLAVPALLAIHSVYHLRPLGFIISLASITLLAALTVTLALVIIFTLSLLLDWFSSVRRVRYLSLKNLALATALVTLFTTLIFWQTAATGDLVNLVGPGSLHRPFASTQAIQTQFQLLPSHLSAVTLFQLQNHYPIATMLPLLKLVTFTFLTFLIFERLTRRYLPLWQTLQEGHFQAHTSAQISTRSYRLPSFLVRPLGIIFTKEVLTTFRNLKSLMWLSFLLLIWLAQVALNLFLKSNLDRYQESFQAAPALVQALQLLVVVHFISAFTLRFAFPSFSTERRTAWIIASAPIRLTRIFAAKLLFFAIAFTGLSLTVSLVNAFILNFPLQAAGLFLLTVLISSIFVTTFGLSMGALFPNFTTDDPEVLSTSLPGLAFILGSLIYGALSASSFYLFLTSGSPFLLLTFLLLSVGFTGLFLYLPTRRLPRFEFAKTIS
jgi:hypothetical protein